MPGAIPPSPGGRAVHRQVLSVRSWLALAVLWLAVPAAAQQPFVVDDAGITQVRTVHIELSDQVDGLRQSARPTRWQNVFEVAVNTGVAGWLELGATVPFISLVAERSASPRVVSGIGDTTVSAKARLTRRPGATHTFAGSMTLGIPSGERSRNLGSGLVDYGVTAISQHRLDGRWTLRLNAGAVLAGNTTTGLVGITQRGAVLIGGSSLIAQVGARLQVGGEFAIAWSQKATLAGSLATAQIGGNVLLRDGCTLDFSAGTGWFDSSPHTSLQVGLSIDLSR